MGITIEDPRAAEELEEEREVEGMEGGMEESRREVRRTGGRDDIVGDMKKRNNNIHKLLLASIKKQNYRPEIYIMYRYTSHQPQEVFKAKNIRQADK